MNYKRKALLTRPRLRGASDHTTNRLATFQIVVGTIVSLMTAFIGWQTYSLSSQSAQNGNQLKALEQKISENKFDFDRMRDIYDRTEKYLEDSAQSPARGRVLVALINRLPDDSARSELLAVVSDNANLITVASDAAILRKNGRSSTVLAIGHVAIGPFNTGGSTQHNSSPDAPKPNTFVGSLSLSPAADGQSFVTRASFKFIDSKGISWDVPKSRFRNS